MGRPKGSTTRGETVQIAVRVSVPVYEAAQALAAERGLSMTMLIETVLREETQRGVNLQTQRGGTMWRVMVTDENGAILEKSPPSGPDQATTAWETAWENPEYAGKKLSLKLLEKNTILISHRFDCTPELFGWLPKSAASEFFGG